ncbi:unnamed protein product [Hermetia illucens]|uniref:CHK kinase-like domain-containing protein n=1 Tax=Hermetia illucens TaxID=343691 RepID=A0A7R8YZ80_HERIL|nr:uncharacterized protein LOC119653721 [Hermetia illucens]CAD7087526.1 unnamed protein product [Hermetia illucens]
MSQKFLLPERVRRELEDYLVREHGIKDVDFKIERASTNGDNFSSDIYRVIVISGENENCNSPEQSPRSKVQPFRFILKTSPTVEIRRQMFNTTKQFFYEHYMYTVVLPALRAFQLQRLPEHEIFDNYPKMISGTLDFMQEYIVLEDMSTKGFGNVNRSTPLKFEECEAVFKALAKLHAVSFAYKDQNPSELKKLVEPLEEIVFKTPLQEDFDNFLRHKIVVAITTLNENEEHIKGPILEFQKIFGKSMIECTSEKTHAAILHGDCWISNLLFRKEDTPPKLDITFLDWQIGRYGTPIIDLSYFIFCCTDNELRKRLPELLEIYYQALAQRISALGTDANVAFPYATFKSHVKKYMKFGFGMALMSLHTISCDPNEMPDVTDVLDNIEDFGEFNKIANMLSERSAYKERMAGVCRDIVEFGYV